MAEIEEPMIHLQSSSIEQVNEPVDIFGSLQGKFQLPDYIKNMFLACGYDTLDVIAEMDACPKVKLNDIDRMFEYVNQTFPHDAR